MILQLDKEELILQNHAWIEALADAVGELVPDVHVENIKAGVYTGIVQVLNLHPKELSLSALTQFFEERISALLLEIMRKPDDERMRAYETIYKIFRRVL